MDYLMFLDAILFQALLQQNIGNYSKGYKHCNTGSKTEVPASAGEKIAISPETRYLTAKEKRNISSHICLYHHDSTTMDQKFEP